MQDYAADVTTLITQYRQPPVLIGWSMGGLVALMVAATGVACACAGLAPSAPARQVDTSVVLRTGEFGQRSMASRAVTLMSKRPCLTWIARNV